jgi:hypothetical protein
MGHRNCIAKTLIVTVGTVAVFAYQPQSGKCTQASSSYQCMNNPALPPDQEHSHENGEGQTPEPANYSYQMVGASGNNNNNSTAYSTVWNSR